MPTIGVIGSGNMAAALAEAVSKKITKRIVMSDRNQARIDFVSKNLKVRTTTSNVDVAKKSGIIFLCVKPQDIPGVLDEICPYVKNQLVVSIAAGVKLGYIEAKLKNARIIRVMPNIACLVGETAAGFSLGKNATKKDANAIKKILDSAGKSFLLEEKLLDAVTAISGSGPAFFAYFLSAVIDAGKIQGLSEENASKLAKQALFGTAKLLIEKNLSPEQLVRMVASKGGTTEAGLKVMEQHNLKETISEAVDMAVKRSIELSKR